MNVPGGIVSGGTFGVVVMPGGSLVIGGTFTPGGNLMPGGSLTSGVFGFGGGFAIVSGVPAFPVMAICRFCFSILLTTLPANESVNLADEDASVSIN